VTTSLMHLSAFSDCGSRSAYSTSWLFGRTRSWRLAILSWSTRPSLWSQWSVWSTSAAFI